MIIDCTKWKAEDVDYRRVFVDGNEIKKVWYVDTDAGFVKTLDVFGDGLARISRRYTNAEMIELGLEDRNGVLSKTVKGKVKLV